MFKKLFNQPNFQLHIMSQKYGSQKKSDCMLFFQSRTAHINDDIQITDEKLDNSCSGSENLVATGHRRWIKQNIIHSFKI